MRSKTKKKGKTSGEGTQPISTERKHHRKAVGLENDSLTEQAADALIKLREKTQSEEPLAPVSINDLLMHDDPEVVEQREHEKRQKQRADRLKADEEKHEARELDKKEEEKMSQAISDFEKSMSSSIEKNRRSNETGLLDSKMISFNNDGMVPPWKRWNLEMEKLARNSFQSEYSVGKKSQFKNALVAHKQNHETSDNESQVKLGNSNSSLSCLRKSNPY